MAKMSVHSIFRMALNCWNTAITFRILFICKIYFRNGIKRQHFQFKSMFHEFVLLNCEAFARWYFFAFCFFFHILKSTWVIINSRFTFNVFNYKMRIFSFIKHKWERIDLSDLFTLLKSHKKNHHWILRVLHAIYRIYVTNKCDVYVNFPTGTMPKIKTIPINFKK